jgi:hypothetical protein
MVVENLNQHTVDEVSQLSAPQGPQADHLANQSRRTLEHNQVLLQITTESGGMVRQVQDPDYNLALREYNMHNNVADTRKYCILYSPYLLCNCALNFSSSSVSSFLNRIMPSFSSPLPARVLIPLFILTCPFFVGVEGAIAVLEAVELVGDGGT